MNTPKHTSLLVLLLLSLTVLYSGCVTTQIESNKDPQYTHKMHKTLLVFNTTKETRDYFTQLSANIRFKFPPHKVETKAFFNNPISLDPDKDLRDAIEQFQPDALLVFNPRGGTISSSGWGIQTLVGLNLDLQIIIPGQKTPVWRASTAISGSGDIEVGIEKTAKQIIKQLVKDGMME